MKYYASEIDKYAIQVCQRNFPDTTQLGDIRGVQTKEGCLLVPHDGKDITKGAYRRKIDLLIGGSPCQDVSFAGKGKGLIDGERSSLFFEFVRLYQELNPKYFILENVKMKKNSEAIITHCLGVHPIEINSSLFSAQNRKRLYWTNIPLDKLPEDKGILLKDILLDDAEEPMLSNIYGGFKEKKPRVHYGKSVTIRTASGGGHIPSVALRKHVIMSKSFTTRNAKSGCLIDSTKPKASSFSAMEYVKNGRQGDYIKCDKKGVHSINGSEYRKLHPIECERLQTVPDNYTEGVSNTQRFKMIGNGMTVDVIAFLLKNAKGIDNVLSCFDGMSCGQLALRRVQDGSL